MPSIVEFFSCMCSKVECDCPCVSGGMDKEGNVVANVCINSICKQHGERCIVRHWRMDYEGR